MNSINILTICTGRYTLFFDNFYESCEKHFLKNLKKNYFVFTDGQILKRSNIFKIEQKKLGWPYDTMMRFKMFNSIEKKLQGNYTFFFNANMLIVDDIDDDILPKIENDYLVGVIHPGYQNYQKHHYPYERNINSKVFIPFEDGECYYQGCLNGGRTEEFMYMSNILEKRIDDDLSVGHIPIWHDESALNWYYSKRNSLKLSPSYAYPESLNMNIEKKIIQLDKNKLGGHSFLRS